jgi:hypothetical protein
MQELPGDAGARVRDAIEQIAVAVRLDALVPVAGAFVPV